MVVIRHRRRLAFVLFGLVVCGALVAGAFAGRLVGPVVPPDPGAGQSAARTPGADAPTSSAGPVVPATGDNLPCTGVEQSLNFDSSWAGGVFDRLRLTAVIRRCDVPRADEPVRANYVSYIYGDCVAHADAGCAPPIEIQSWPARERNKQTQMSVPGAPADRGTDTTVGDLPATWYEDGRRLEIYGRSATVVIFGDDPARIERYSMALVKGPAVLADLSRQGIVFRACVGANYCAGGPGGDPA